MEPHFFDSPEAFRRWLAAHGATSTELLVGFHKRATGRPTLTWPQSVDEALCVGWIDGVRKRIDDERYQIRFTPRKSTSIWSAVNIARVAELSAQKRMRPAGLAAFALRREAKSGTYAYEQKQRAELTPDDEALFRSHAAAWTFFNAQPPGYRQRMLWGVASAKQAATRQRRLAALIDASGQSRRL